MNQDKLVSIGIDKLLYWGPRVITVIVVFVVARIVARWLANRSLAVMEKKSVDPTIARFGSKIIRYAVLTAAVIGCLGIAGIETTSFAALIAAMGLAIGMALQGTLSNFAAGVMLLIFRPFKVDDFISVSDESGTVEEIELFTTAIQTLDGKRVFIPNSKVFGEKIQNLSFYDGKRRVDIPVGADYSANIDQTRQALNAAAAKVNNQLAGSSPQVFLKSLGDSCVDWEVRIWCHESHYWTVHEETIQAVKESLDAANIGIPFPQMDVHLDK